MPALILHGRSYAVSQLGEVNPADGETQFGEGVLAFCKKWIGGEDLFHVPTSGSTGPPRLIALTRAQLEASARLTIDVLGLTERMTSLVCLDPRHIGGTMMLARSLVAGMNMYATEPSANPLPHVPASQRLDFAAFVPYQLKNILGSPQATRLNALHAAIVGGAEVDAATIARLQDIRCTLYATFGMTETVSHVALRALNGANPSSHFTSLPGISLATDERGCLVISAPYLPKEVVTNDLVELISREEFRWLGRWDNVINTGGVKVSPEIVEDRIRTLLGGIPFFVAGIPDERLGQAVALFIKSESWGREQTDALQAGMSRLLSAYEVPRRIIVLKELALTASGKIDRKKSVRMAD